jgi:IS30 family transposase
MTTGSSKHHSHLKLEQRKVIEQGLNEGTTLRELARQIGVDAATVRREIKRNRRSDGKSKNRTADVNDCEHLRYCKVRSACLGSCSGGLCKRCWSFDCTTVCPDYVRRICKTVDKAPFTCNACKRYGQCTLERWRYSAENAQGTSDRRARDGRCGIDLTKDEFDSLVEIVRSGLKLGQSIHHIFATNDMPVSERSFYRYVQDEDVPILSIELAKKVKYKKRKKKKVDTHESGFFKDHEYEDYLELDEDYRAITTEVDTVLGKKTDRKCILSLHRIDLHFQIYLLLEGRTKQCVVEAMDWLERCCDYDFSAFFGLMLLDRGSEFDDIKGMESKWDNKGYRCECYFADPNRPDQKGACEKNHVELRKVLPKGTSLDGLDQYTLSEICSHVNSTVRKGCGDVSPMQMAQLVLPKDLLDALGLRLIPPKDVISAPGILYNPDDK